MRKHFLRQRSVQLAMVLGVAASLVLQTVPSVQAAGPSVAEIKALQQDLNADLIGMPKLVVDGKIGPLTRRALCAERLLTGGTASIATPSSEEIKSLQAKDTLRSSFSGLLINKTCQVMVINVGGKLTAIVPVSTGRSGHTTPSVTTSLSFGRYGWHDSTKYPSEDGNGNMYKPLYFASGSGIAIHGSNAMTLNTTSPQSHGCIRITVAQADKMWQLAGGPTTARNDQYISNIKHIPVRVQN